jgi:hypothetical protein
VENLPLTSLILVENMPPVSLIPVVHLECEYFCKYLCKFSKKFEKTPMLFSGAWGKMIHEKT